MVGVSFAERFRAARLRRAQLELTQFEYEWAATGIWGGAFACYLKQSPKDTERAIDAMLERNDAFFITASAARYLADEGHFTIVDDSDRRNIVLRRADPC